MDTTFEQFRDAAADALDDITGSGRALVMEKGRDFNFSFHADVDSLDMLDIMFLMRRRLKVSIGPEFEGNTLGDLYVETLRRNNAAA